MNVPAPSVQDQPEAPGIHARRLWSFRPRSDRQSGDAIVSNFALHWFPAKVSRASLDWTYSFWLGTVSAALLLLPALPAIRRRIESASSAPRTSAMSGVEHPLYAVSLIILIVVLLSLIFIL